LAICPLILVVNIFITTLSWLLMGWGGCSFMETDC